MLNILEDLKINSFHKIAGDASFRNFYRVKYQNKNCIFIYCEKDKKNNLDNYYKINKFLRNNKLLSPKTFKFNSKKNFMLIEDLGKQSYHAFLQQQKNKFTIYKKLVDELIKIQSIPFIQVKKITQFYSKQKLIKESNLFFEWYLPRVFKKKKALVVTRKIKKILFPLFDQLSCPNHYFVHRDFHVSNLIRHGDKVGIIDSQDALLGNPSYDLMSLIDDVRIKTSLQLKKQIFQYYLSKTKISYAKEVSSFQKDFDILSIQRSLKIIGIFSRLCIRDKKKNYIKMLPYVWSLLHLRLKNPCFVELAKVIKKYFPKKLIQKTII